MNRRRALASLLVAVGMLASLPQAALAHGLVGREDLPIPKWLFIWASAIVLFASFVGLAVLWPKPRMEEPTERRTMSLPKLLDPLCGLFGVFSFVVVVYAGFAGSQTTTINIAPTFIFVIFWVGVPVASVLFGDVFKPLNPWRAIARAVAGIASFVSRGRLPEPMPYPTALGRWPAMLGILAFAWVELVYSGRGEPSNLAILVVAYAAAQFVGMSLYGIDAWSRYGDAFGVYFGLFARISPLRWERGALYRRKPFSGLTTLDAVPGTVALLCTMIGTTSFDGFSAGPVWGNIAPRMADSLRSIGFSQATALEIAFTIGLLVVVAIVSGIFRVGVIGMRRASNTDMAPDQLAARFAHSLVPIAFAYVLAHYFSLLGYQGQAMFYLVSDPLGTGANIFGTSQTTIDYQLFTANMVWYVQVAALVSGHVAGLVLAHDRALVTFKDPRAATRSQYWMLAVMIAFTSLGLWLLSAAQ